MKKPKALMFQGTSSYCGKSLIVTAFCRIFKELGYKVAPFKAQNMSLNSFVTKDGAEIARAQALQALAAGVEPTADMNPILIKPKGGLSSQIVLLGKPYMEIDSSNYYKNFALKYGIKEVKKALKRLMKNYDLILIEGAGSPVEINLQKYDIANMRIAEVSNAPVILIADIDRGGVFASIIGTLFLLKNKHRKRIKGFIINKFRGEISCLKPGLNYLKKITKKAVYGVVPYIDGLILPFEDSVSLDEKRRSSFVPKAVEIAVIRFPRISNFTDFDPLELDPNVSIRFVSSLNELKNPDAIILPGTKNTIRDLIWLKEVGLDKKILELQKKGIPIIGICGGYQMLGKWIIDKSGIESGINCKVKGLGILDIITSFNAYNKITRQVKAKIIGGGEILESIKGFTISGYEIHMGLTKLGKKSKPIFKIEYGNSEYFDGAINEDGNVFGTYIHGIFDNPTLRKALIAYLMRQKGYEPIEIFEENIENLWMKSIEKLAKVVKENVDIDRIISLIIDS
jgi:adenosylcobyric acid synthase